MQTQLQVDLLVLLDFVGFHLPSLPGRSINGVFMLIGAMAGVGF
jgi:hypothetical protein